MIRPLARSLFLVTLLLGCANETRPPVVQTAAELAATAGARIQLDASGTFDPQDLPLTFEWVFRALPTGSRATLNDPRLQNPSFVADVAGQFVLELSVTNGVAAPAKASVRVTASPCGSQPPSVRGASAMPAVPSVGDLVQLDAIIDDADTFSACRLAADFTYEWAFVGLPRGSAARLNTVVVRNPSFVADVSGDYGVRVVAIDAAGLRSAPFAFSFTAIDCGGGIPVATPRSLPAEPATGDLVQLDVSVADPDTRSTCGRSEIYRYEWSMVAVPAGSRATLSSPMLRNPWFTIDVAGEYIARVVVTDTADHHSAAAAVTVRAGGCGGASPTASIVAPTSGNISGLISLTAQVSDADALPPCSRTERFAYEWSFAELPAGSAARFSDTTLAAPSFAPDVAGRYVVQLAVHDLAGHRSEPASVAISISACGGNRPSATVAANPSPAGVGDTVLLTATVSDADIACGIAESFSHAWTFDGLPPGSSAALNNGMLASPSFVPDVAGLYAIRLVVTDATGRASAPVIASINVAACGSNTPTTAISVDTPTPRVAAPIALSAVVTDADNLAPCNLLQRFTYRWTFDALPPGSASTFNSNTARAPSFTPDLAGTYVVSVVAQDSTGRTSDAVTASINVGTCGGARPTIALLTATTSAPNVGQAVRLSASVSDADNDPPCSLGQSFTYRWAIAQLPVGSTATLNSSTTETPSLTPDVAGAYVLELIVTDSTGRTSSRASATVTAGTCGGNRPTARIVTIAPINDSSSPATVGVGNTVQLDGASSDDADNGAPCSLGQTLSYHWELFAQPASSTSTLDAPSARTPAFRADAAGSYTLRLRVDDGQRFSDYTTFDVTACTPFPACAP